ncbi:MAG: hypothetical protein IT453_19460 [Planctomycetes bacterium]|nr:hypothetical protein [Planctomycetota bacterium]
MTHTRILSVAAALSTLALAAPAFSGIPVTVTVTGTVEYNQITAPPLGLAKKDDVATMTFVLDSSDFVNSPNFPTRGYRIVQSSFTLTAGATTIGLKSPFPAGQTPYFVIRDNDPAVDGFLVSTNVDLPFGVSLNQNGAFGSFIDNFYVTYGGSTLPSLDVLDALGTYTFTGLQVYNWTIDDGPVNPLSIAFSQIEIECGPKDAVIYCQGKVNSQGCTPGLSTDAGSPSMSGGPWNVTASNLLNNKFGVFFYGSAAQNLPFQGGTLCVQLPVVRTPAQSSGGNPPPSDCSGQMVLDITTALPASLAPSFVYIQAWSRDPLAPFGTSLSNAAEILLCP